MARKINRAIHIDFHTMDGIEDFGAGFDGASFAETLSNSHVQYVNVFAQCNLGYAYYPTKVGVPYPYMKGDLFGDMLKECHKRGIGVSAYINLGYNGQQTLLHPEWCQVYPGMEEGIKRMCFHSAAYRDYLLAVIREILSYDVDGLFCDCIQLIRPCYCEECKRDMLARGIDIEKEKEAQAFMYQSMLELCGMIREAVPADKNLFFNGMPYDDMLGLENHIEIECLTGVAGWSQDFFEAQAAYARNLGPDVLYMTGRFQANWGDFGGRKTRDSIESEAHDALCQCVQFSVGDHMHPAWGLDTPVYDMTKDIYGKLLGYEPWAENARYIAQVGVLRNKGELSPSQAQRGASRMLSELKCCFDVINEDMDFEKYPLLFLPDEIRLTKKLEEKLEAFLAQGGNVISTGLSSVDSAGECFPMKSWGFLKYQGQDENETAYYAYKEEVENEGYPIVWAMYNTGILMSSAPEHVVAEYVSPYHMGKPVSPHGLVYTPPRKTSSQAVVARCGNVAHISFPIFEGYYQMPAVFHKELVQRLLQWALPEPLLKTEDIPSATRVTMAQSPTGYLVNVKTTYHHNHVIEEHVRIPGGRIAVKGQYDSVMLLPEMEPKMCRYEDGYTIFETGEIDGFAMYLLKYAHCLL